MEEDNLQNSDTFACVSCGADLKFQAGTNSLTCEYCGATNEIPVMEEAVIEELDFDQYIAQKESAGEIETITEQFVKCESCGATSSLEPNISSSACPFCATPLILDQAEQEAVIQPKSILPFGIKKEEATNLFKNWIKKLKFAPSALKKQVLNANNFKSVYIPYWTFDDKTSSNYVGQRGDYYYETETYTTTEDGKQVTKTRQVQKTRWSFTSGTVDQNFDDVLVLATDSLPRKYARALEPWDLEELKPFDKSYLSGFIAEKYKFELKDSFEVAKQIMDGEIRHSICRQIGGDTQRITSCNTSHNDITFKHLLLPIYVSAYKFKDKVYQFLVNGRTGEVQGERPFSKLKIALAIIIPLGILAALYFFQNQ